MRLNGFWRNDKEMIIVLKNCLLLIMNLLLVVFVATLLAACAFSRFLAESGPSLLYFRATNCPYCRQMTPIVKEIEREYGQRLNVVYATVDEQQGKQLAREHGIIGYPAILLLDSEGERVGILHGVVPRPSLEEMVDDLLQAER